MHYGAENWKFKVVKEGESISLGKRSMTFINTPMAHWPDSMMTYIPEEKLLFTMDVFGQHLASAGRFDDEESFHDIMYEAKKYYANIILPLGSAVVKTLAKASTIDIEMVAPSHGVIFRKYIGEMVASYEKWANHVPSKKMIIFYDSMWKSTDYMARAICEGASQVDGVEIKLYDIKHVHITELATEIIDAAAFAAGSPTLNSNLMPKMAEALTYLQGLAPQNKLAFAFGSYGWSKKGGASAVQTYLENMINVNLLIDTPYQCQFKPDQACLDELQALGKQLGEHAHSVGQ
jgi:flavorubredoxin